MIQRIQTVYLLVSAILISSLFKLKFADIIVNNELHIFNAGGIFKEDTLLINGLPLMIFIGLIVLLHVFIIFMFKKRIRQIRMIVFTIILLLGLFGLIFYFTYNSFDEVMVAFKVPVAFPLVAVILDWLAIRSIGKDEALIRSMDRIR